MFAPEPFLICVILGKSEVLRCLAKGHAPLFIVLEKEEGWRKGQGIGKSRFSCAR